MLVELAELGKAVKNIPNSVGTTNSKTNNDKVIVIKFAENGGHYEYAGVMTADYDEIKFPYFEGGSNGPNISITSRLSKSTSGSKDPCESTVKNRITAWLKGEPKIPIFSDMYNSLIIGDEVKADILRDLQKEHLNVVSNKELKKGGLYLSVCTLIDGKYVYPGEVDDFNFSSDVRKKKAFGEHDGYCLICGEKGKVYGNVLPAIGLRFATTDSKTFTYGLKPEESWKNAPLCASCSENVERGYGYVKKHLTIEKTFDDDIPYNMLVIPTIPSQEALKKFCNNVQNGFNGTSSGILYAEDHLGNIANEQEDWNSFQAYLNLLFYTKEQRAFRIIAYVGEVTPSRLKKVYDTAKGIYGDQGYRIWFLGGESMSLIFGRDSWRAGNPFLGSNITSRKRNNEGTQTLSKKDMNIHWIVSFLSDIFSYEVKENGRDVRKLHTEFFDILTEMFTEMNRRPNLFQRYLEQIKSDFYNAKTGKVNIFKLQEDVLKDLSINIFLMRIVGEIDMNQDLVKETNLSGLERFFTETGLIDEGEKAALLGGILAGRALKVQRIGRRVSKGQEPLWQEFGDIGMMDAWKLRDIVTKSVIKIREYDSAKWPDIMGIEEVALKATSSKSLENTPRTHISFYFVTGVVLGEAIIPVSYTKDNHEDGVKSE